MKIFDMICAGIWFGWFIAITLAGINPPILLAICTTFLLTTFHLMEAFSND